MMCGWSNQSAADWRMPIPFPGIASCNASKASSASPVPGSLPSCGEETNDLPHLRHVASHLVRPPAPAATGYQKYPRRFTNMSPSFSFCHPAPLPSELGSTAAVNILTSSATIRRLKADGFYSYRKTVV